MAVNGYQQGTIAKGINSAGQIVGSYWNGTTNEGFLDTNGTFKTISDGAMTAASGINDSGQIVGSGPGEGFLDTNGTFTTINVPGAASGLATGINNLGQIVGIWNNASGVQQGYLDTNGTITTIDVPGSKWTAVSGINDYGQIVGFYTGAGCYGCGFVATPDGFVGPTPLPPIGGTLPGGLVLLGWLGRRALRRNA